jgi:hypothetical protein
MKWVAIYIEEKRPFRAKWYIGDSVVTSNSDIHLEVVLISGFHAATSCLSEVRLDYIAETFVKHG